MRKKCVFGQDQEVCVFGQDEEVCVFGQEALPCCQLLLDGLTSDCLLCREIIVFPCDHYNDFAYK